MLCCKYTINVYMWISEVLCADLPDDIQKNSTDYSFGSTVDMNCDAFGNTRIPGVPVGESLTVTCQANKTWTDWDDHENGCIGNYSRYWIILHVFSLC